MNLKLDCKTVLISVLLFILAGGLFMLFFEKSIFALYLTPLLIVIPVGHIVYSSWKYHMMNMVKNRTQDGLKEEIENFSVFRKILFLRIVKKEEQRQKLEMAELKRKYKEIVRTSSRINQDYADLKNH